MLNKLMPNERYHSAYDIPYEELFKEGYRGIIYDIDNTLVCHDAPANEKAVELFIRLRKIGFFTCLISNNDKERVTPFANLVGSMAVYKAHKPSKKKYIEAMEKMHTTPATTFFVGDQVFTDVLGANRCHIPSILTDPISPKEEIQIVLKRYLEKIVLHFYKEKEARKLKNIKK